MTKPPTSPENSTELDRLWRELHNVYADAKRTIGDPVEQGFEPEQLGKFFAADKKAEDILRRIREIN